MSKRKRKQCNLKIPIAKYGPINGPFKDILPEDYADLSEETKIRCGRGYDMTIQCPDGHRVKFVSKSKNNRRAHFAHYNNHGNHGNHGGCLYSTKYKSSGGESPQHARAKLRFGTQTMTTFDMVCQYGKQCKSGAGHIVATSVINPEWTYRTEETQTMGYGRRCLVDGAFF